MADFGTAVTFDVALPRRGYVGGVIAPGLPLMMSVTYRPEFEPPWPAGGFVSAYTLTRLSRRLGADLVAGVTGGKRLPDAVLEQIVAKTDGIPLFVEELTKTVLEAGFLKEAPDAYTLDAPLPPLAIPATLQDSLMARLDRLAPVKEVAQLGACIGREFSHALLAAVSPLADGALQAAVQELVDSELIFRRGAAPEARYTFKHALVQDAAYGSLLKSRRITFHRDIAHAIEGRFPFQAADSPEIVAYHYTQAELPDLAVPYWSKAGDRALRYGSPRDAREHYATALRLLKKLEPIAERKLTHTHIVLKWGANSHAVVSKGLVEEVLIGLGFCRDLGQVGLAARVKSYLGWQCKGMM